MKFYLKFSVEETLLKGLERSTLVNECDDLRMTLKKWVDESMKLTYPCLELCLMLSRLPI